MIDTKLSKLVPDFQRDFSQDWKKVISQMKATEKSSSFTQVPVQMYILQTSGGKKSFQCKISTYFLLLQIPTVSF